MDTMILERTLHSKNHSHHLVIYLSFHLYFAQFFFFFVNLFHLILRIFCSVSMHSLNPEYFVAFNLESANEQNRVYLESYFGKNELNDNVNGYSRCTSSGKLVGPTILCRPHSLIIVLFSLISLPFPFSIECLLVVHIESANGSNGEYGG